MTRHWMKYRFRSTMKPEKLGSYFCRQRKLREFIKTFKRSLLRVKEFHSCSRKQHIIWPWPCLCHYPMASLWLFLPNETHCIWYTLICKLFFLLLLWALWGTWIEWSVRIYSQYPVNLCFVCFWAVNFCCVEYFQIVCEKKSTSNTRKFVKFNKIRDVPGI